MQTVDHAVREIVGINCGQVDLLKNNRIGAEAMTAMTTGIIGIHSVGKHASGIVIVAKCVAETNVNWERYQVATTLPNYGTTEMSTTHLSGTNVGIG